MKILNKSIIGCILLAGISLTSCDFLDVVPKENATGEDMSKDRQAPSTIFVHATATCHSPTTAQARSTS